VIVPVKPILAMNGIGATEPCTVVMPVILVEYNELTLQCTYPNDL